MLRDIASTLAVLTVMNSSANPLIYGQIHRKIIKVCMFMLQPKERGISNPNKPISKPNLGPSTNPCRTPTYSSYLVISTSTKCFQTSHTFPEANPETLTTVL